jgi:hypothetical protein
LWRKKVIEVKPIIAKLCWDYIHLPLSLYQVNVTLVVMLKRFVQVSWKILRLPIVLWAKTQETVFGMRI